MIKPSKIIKGSCEITTGAFIPEIKPPVYQGESGTVKVELSLLENGTPYAIPTRSEAYFYLNYDARKRRTTSMPMSIDNNMVYGLLTFDHTLLSGAPDIVVIVYDELMNTQVACKIPIRIIESMADLAVYTAPPPPGITIYVGRSPYIDEDGYYVEWDDEAQVYVKTNHFSRGEAGTVAIVNTQTIAPEEQARFEETAESTPNDRKYEAYIPEGKKGESATFEIVGTLTGDKDGSATTTEADDSTPQHRKYIVTIPAPKTGEPGKDGNDFIIKGKYITLEDLVADLPVGEAGDSYFVGSAPPFDVYVWDVNAEEWFNAGVLEGPPGNVPGPQGPPGNLQYATFEVDFETRQLVMITPEDYSGVEWRINPETRELEWGINTDIKPGQIGEQTGTIRTPLGGVILRPRGAYDADETYDRMDVVLHGSNSYVCINPIAGIAPGNTEYWLSLTNVPEGVDLSALAEVARTGSYNDLKDKPEIPDLGTLAEVARTGDYEDLSNLPTIPGKVSDLANDAGFQTAAQVQTAITNVTSTIEADLSGYVPVSRKVAGKPLDADITLSASDVDAVPTTRTVNGQSLSEDITLNAASVNAVPATRTVNSKALSADVVLSASDVGAVATSQIIITTTAPTEGSALAANTIVYVV